MKFKKWMETTSDKVDDDLQQQLAVRLEDMLHTAFWLNRILEQAKGKIPDEVSQEIKTAIKLLHSAGERLGLYS